MVGEPMAGPPHSRHLQLSRSMWYTLVDIFTTAGGVDARPTTLPDLIVPAC